MTHDNAKDQPSDEADEALVARSQAGDAAAFGVLYERFLDKIYRYIFYRVGNHADAEDLTEIVFIKAWKGIGTYQPQGVPFLAWLYRIARNAVIDFRRSNKIEQVDIESQYDLPDGADGTELQVLKRVTVQRLFTALDQLETAQRDVLIFRFLQGLSHKDTAEIMERTPGAIRVLQHRALAALRLKFRSDDDENEV